MHVSLLNILGAVQQCISVQYYNDTAVNSCTVMSTVLFCVQRILLTTLTLSDRVVH